VKPISCNPIASTYPNAVQIVLILWGVFCVILAGVSTVYSALMYHRLPTNSSNSTKRDRNATDSAPPAKGDFRELLVGRLTEISDLLTQIHEQSKGDTVEIKETLQDLAYTLKDEAQAEFIVQHSSPRGNHHAVSG
jgi:hypothetical protein